MSVFGGDSWARESQQRKRRLDDLMLPSAATSSSSSLSPSGSFKRLSSGKFACFVCPHHPVLDSPLMISMHIKGSRHIAAESTLKEKELQRQNEINKRLALSSVAYVSKHSSNKYPSVMDSGTKEKPLTEQTRRAILEAQSTRFNNFSATKESHDVKMTGNALYRYSQVAPFAVPLENCTENTGSIESKNIEGGPFTGDKTPRKVLSQWQVDKKRQEQELRFTASGWKRDCHGKWYRDEDVEFDSDEDDPNICLG
uniref:Uncharacterized protein n=1 Tax=Avena sativa TaxID=4498 RepID=A0ACD5ZPF5_AVESA